MKVKKISYITSLSSLRNTKQGVQNKKIKAIGYVIILLIFLLPWNCDKMPLSQSGPIEFKVEKAFSAEQPGEDFFFAGILNICANSEYIYISDWKTYSLKIFDHNFNLIKKVGNKGNGPGEFGQIFAGMACNDEMVFLITINRLYTFSARGEFIRETILKFLPGQLFATSTGLLFTRDHPGSVFVLTDYPGNIIESFYKPVIINSPVCGKITAPPHAYVSKNGRLFVMSSTHYNIDLIDWKTGEINRSITREVDFRGVYCVKGPDNSITTGGGTSWMLESKDKLFYFYYDSQKKLKIDIYDKTDANGMRLNFSGHYRGDFVPRCILPGHDSFLGTKPEEEHILYRCCLDILEE